MQNVEYFVEFYKNKILIYAQSIERIYRDFQPTHPGGLNIAQKKTLKKKVLELSINMNII